MAIQTWFTQPKESFSSFYWYDTDSKDCVRIRLELGRKSTRGDSGRPIIVVTKNRYVGFSMTNYAAKHTKNKWSFIDKQVAINDEELEQLPEIGKPNYSQYYVFDTSVAGEETRHYGNHLTSSPILPKNVNERMLCEIAQYSLSIAQEELVIVDICDIDEQILSQSLNKIYNDVLKGKKDSPNSTCCSLV